MNSVITIVEGDGEVEALPLLLRRLGQWRTPQKHVLVPRPIRVRRDRFLRREDDFQKHLQLAGAKASVGGAGVVLVLLDADDDCPAALGTALSTRVRQALPLVKSQVVLANREYEAWFIAAADSLDGRRSFALDRPPAFDPDVPRDAKGWLRERMVGRSYSELTDQPAFSAAMDLELAHSRSRSFRQLVAAWDRLLG